MDTRSGDETVGMSIARHHVCIDIEPLYGMCLRTAISSPELNVAMNQYGILSIDELLTQAFFLMPYFLNNDMDTVDDQLSSMANMILEKLPMTEPYTSDMYFADLVQALLQLTEALVMYSITLFRRHVPTLGNLAFSDLVSTRQINGRILELTYE